MARSPGKRLALGPLEATLAGPAEGATLADCVAAAGDYFRRAEGPLPAESIASDKLAEAELDADRRVYVLRLDGAAVGILDLALHRPADRDATIALLVLAQRQRRQGLGRSCVEALFDELRACGFERIHLGVAPGERAAAAFWAAVGMTESGREGSVRLFELALAP